MANVLHCNIGVSEFEFHSRFYVHFRFNTMKRGMKITSSPPVKDLVVSLQFLFICIFGIK